ncbi:hypothetical protein R3P38DRAFT_2793694 [Favolaschia claudopus]|uniref:Uncharacterized protein n=1 Tax=Favolaschia claudopus TaxID=2862362 RepID=A0AAW0AD14_9AGAR
MEVEWPRCSSDETVNTRRQAILECDSYGLCIVNGTALETVSPGRYTSHQPTGQSTIDYAFVSYSLLSFVKELHVDLPTSDPKDDWADHTRIALRLDISQLATVSVSKSSRKSQRVQPPSSVSGPRDSRLIDRLYQETMESAQSRDDAQSLWGPLTAESGPKETRQSTVNYGKETPHRLAASPRCCENPPQTGSLVQDKSPTPRAPLDCVRV